MPPSLGSGCDVYVQTGMTLYYFLQESPNSSMLHTIDNCEKHEASITVEGSYGTKVFYRIILL